MTDYRVSARRRGYDNAWDKAAKLYRRANPLCVGCLALGRIEPATLVDHIEPHKGDQARFNDQANWQSSCKWHHDSIKKQLEALFERNAIPAAELKLDSPKAISLSRNTPRPISAVDQDGWPIE